MNDVLTLKDNDFTEMIIKYMIRDPNVYRKCREMVVVGDDFVFDEVFGNQVYKHFVDIVNSVGNVPIIQDTFMRHIRAKLDDGEIESDTVDELSEFLGFIYGTPLDDPNYILKHLPAFIGKHRTSKILIQYKDDPAELLAKLNKSKFLQDSVSSSSGVQILHPFKDLIFQTKSQLIGTNIAKLDEKLHGGLMLGEYALLVGFSGGGKSATGVNMVCNSAKIGSNSTYVSCEDTKENMANRFYSKAYHIPYSHLRDGKANYELEAKHAEFSSAAGFNLGNCLSMISTKGVSEITPDFLYYQLVHEYEETGFVPTLVMLDQMQFVTPNTTTRKGASPWELEKVVSEELDQLSHRKIGGRNFVLWVQHQAKGKLKKRFTRDDIDGFKGIIHKADLVVGVGRSDKEATEIDLFSIKVRHFKDFGITLKTDFAYMDISSDISEPVSMELPATMTANPVNQSAPNVEEALPANPMAHG